MLFPKQTNLESGSGSSRSTITGSHLDAGLLFALADSFNVSELELWLKKVFHWFILETFQLEYIRSADQLSQLFMKEVLKIFIKF